MTQVRNDVAILDPTCSPDVSDNNCTNESGHISQIDHLHQRLPKWLPVQRLQPRCLQRSNWGYRNRVHRARPGADSQSWESGAI